MATIRKHRDKWQIQVRRAVPFNKTSVTGLNGLRPHSRILRPSVNFYSIQCLAEDERVRTLGGKGQTILHRR